MSDLLLTDTPDGADVTLRNGQPATTNGLTSAAYLSLFTPRGWQDMTRQAGERYGSRIPRIKSSRSVSNQTRLALISAGEDALAWMVSDASAEIEVDATIESARRIDLSVTITGPQDTESATYGVNWAATSEEVR